MGCRSDKRGRFRELQTRGSDGPIEFELKYRERPGTPIITYHLAINAESLQWRRGSRGKPFRFLNFRQGAGQVAGDNEGDMRIEEQRINAWSATVSNPRVSALRRWLAPLLPCCDATRGVTEAGPQERLSETDNLPNVIQYLKEQYVWMISSVLSMSPQKGKRRVDETSSVAEKMLLLNNLSWRSLPPMGSMLPDLDPEPPQLIGIEEPENYLHPRLLSGCVVR